VFIGNSEMRHRSISIQIPQKIISLRIVFKEVYPLYGQIDIKGSSEHRNSTVKEDLKNQLNVLSEIFENLEAKSTLPLLEQRKFEMQSFAEELQLELKADTEQQIQNYIQKRYTLYLSNSKIEGSIINK
jgi:hypothetical protein